MSEVYRGSAAEVALAFGELARSPDYDPSKTYAVSEVRRKRSLTQNAYYWAMLNKLARVLDMPDSELHERMLDEYGVADIWDIDQRALGLLKHYRLMSSREEGGRRMCMVKWLKGSSEMDSAEFSRLIDGMRQECEAQGINVLTPAEIAALRFVEPEGGKQ